MTSHDRNKKSVSADINNRRPEFLLTRTLPVQKPLVVRLGIVGLLLTTFPLMTATVSDCCSVNLREYFYFLILSSD